MKSYWRVTKVTATQTTITADLVRWEWFKKNPAAAEQMERFRAIEDAQGIEAADRESLNWPDVGDEFIDAEPWEDGADFLDTGDTMHVEVPDGQELRAGDDVLIELTVIAEPADA